MRSRLRILVLAGAAMVEAGCPLEPLEAPALCELGGCDDGNVCTRDRCDEASRRCVFEALPKGTQCDPDQDACNGIDRCDASGVCVPGEPLEVDDQNPCTIDSCDPLTAVIHHEPLPGCSPSSSSSGGGAGGAGGSGAGGAGGGDPVAPPLWKSLSTEGAPSARRLHAAVWTGSQMIVWGGLTTTGVTNSGGVYDPTTDTWKPTAVANAPSGRHSHSAIWTGSEMIVWGGFSNTYEATGGRYDPVRDEWTPLPFTTIKGRARHVAVWTGADMIVWGGSNGVAPQGDGSRYSLGANTWTNLPGGGPSARFNSVGVWTGSSLAVWGGLNTFDWFADGKYHNPSLNNWTSISNTNRPTLRESASYTWTGAGLLLWSGWNGGDFLQDGALLKPAVGTGGTWSTISVALAPSPRAQNATFWTGSELCVWGGCGEDACGQVREDGGCYSTSKDSWRAIPAEEAFPGRIAPAAVWTGTELIVFGGERNLKAVGGGGRLSLGALLE